MPLLLACWIVQAPLSAHAESFPGTGGSDRDEPMTAADLLKELQRQRPPNEVIAPVGSTLDDLRAVRTVLFPEGATLVESAGRLEYEPPWWVFHELGAEPARVMKMLPNIHLERMVRTTLGAEGAVRFTVSGEFTVYRGENFLLPTFAVRLLEALEPSAVDAPTATPEKVSIDASTEDVYNVLRGLEPPGSLRQESDWAGDVAHPGAPRPGVPRLLGDASLVARPGRIVREGDWWTFVFESDHPDHAELPIRILPNMNLDLMIEAAEFEQAGLVYIVSGDVTAFGSENFLLPRIAMRRVDTGNLRN